MKETAIIVRTSDGKEFRMAVKSRRDLATKLVEAVLDWRAVEVAIVEQKTTKIVWQGESEY